MRLVLTGERSASSALRGASVATCFLASLRARRSLTPRSRFVFECLSEWAAADQTGYGVEKCGEGGTLIEIDGARASAVA